ncbi:MAG: tape measure protein, partial [Cyanobium sp. 49614_E6]|nr:tape measure protein [Cyanobium sp. 49614_E6]
MASFEQQILVTANISPAERAVGKLTTGLSRIEKLAKGSLDGLKNTRLNFDTRGAEQQISRLKQGIAGLNQRVRVRVEEVYSRREETPRNSGGGVAILGGGRKQPGAAAVGAATAALQQQQDALRDLISSSDRYEQLQQAQATAADKLATKTEELSQAQRRLQQNQNGFADKGKSLAQSLRDSTNAVDMRTRALERYQQELADTSAAVYRYGAAERRVAAELNQAEYERTKGGLSFDRRLANRRQQNARQGANGKAAAAGVASAGLFIPGLSEVTTGAAAGFAVGGAGGAAIGAAAAGLTAVAAVAVKGAAAVASYSAEVSKLRTALQGISTSQADFQASLAGVDRIANRLNIPLKDATEQFTSLRASMAANGYSAADTLKVYESLSAANTALGGDSQKLQGILLATSQVFSKGKVTAEELRGQIGERLPGAFSEFARATGRTTAQLDQALSDGEVSLADFVKFADSMGRKYGTTADRMARSGESAGARLAKAMETLNLKIGPELQRLGAQFQDFATTAINSLMQVFDYLGKLGTTIEEKLAGNTLKNAQSQFRTDSARLKDLYKTPKEQRTAEQTRQIGMLEQLQRGRLATMTAAKPTPIPATPAPTSTPLPTSATSKESKAVEEAVR